MIIKVSKKVARIQATPKPKVRRKKRRPATPGAKPVAAKPIAKRTARTQADPLAMAEEFAGVDDEIKRLQGVKKDLMGPMVEAVKDHGLQGKRLALADGRGVVIVTGGGAVKGLTKAALTVEFGAEGLAFYASRERGDKYVYASVKV